MNRYTECENSKIQTGLNPPRFIFRARDTLTDDIVFIKTKHYDGVNEGVPQDVIRESSILRELSHHPNIIQLNNCIFEPSSVTLIFEDLELDLLQFIASDRFKNSPLPQELVKSFLSQICCAIAFCHSRGVMHRNLSPRKILVNETGDGIKVSGFNSARSFLAPLNRELTMEVTRLWYRAPEILLGMKKYSPHVDIFAMGCIFAQLVSKEALFQGHSAIDQLFKIFHQLGTPDENSWSDLSSATHWNADFPKWNKRAFDKKIQKNLSVDGIDLLDRFLRCNPSLRIPAKDAVYHDYFIK